MLFIGKSAFNNVVNAESIRIPNSVTSIGSYAFAGCEKLKEINIPEGVPSIEMVAFKGCKSLTSVVIPSTVTIIYGTKEEKITYTKYGDLDEHGNWKDCRTYNEVHLPVEVLVREFEYWE